MFDHFHRHSAPVTHVKIEQQPNDAADAARLHGEIRAKAIKEVEGAVIAHLGAHNEFTVVKAHSEISMYDMHTHVRALFTLNGRQYSIEVSESDLLDRKIMDVIAGSVTSEIMKQLARPAPQSNEGAK